MSGRVAVKLAKDIVPGDRLRVGGNEVCEVIRTTDNQFGYRTFHMDNGQVTAPIALEATVHALVRPTALDPE